jgi:class 3 adenylate cyclase
MSSRQSLPEHPALADIARELEKARGASMIYDAEWRLVWVSDELCELVGEHDPDRLGVGLHVVEALSGGPWAATLSVEDQLKIFMESWPLAAYDTPSGVEGVKAALRRGLTNPRVAAASAFEDVADEALDALFIGYEPVEPSPVYTDSFQFLQGDLPPTPINETSIRIRDKDGAFLGTVVLYVPGLPASVLSLVARGDEGMFQRMARLARPGRKQAAVLFADLESSSSLSRHLPSAAYFRLIRALTGAIDEVVGRHRGVVGKHAGDGVTAFFLAEDLGSPSAAARAAISTAREVSSLAKLVAGDLGEEIGILDEELCKINVGVHWGGRLFMGQLVTGGRLEVTALGDAVNECARIQESAREGTILGSKSLIEHLTDEDAAALELDPDTVLYRTIEELPEAPPKAKRDAGGLPVAPL